MHEFKGSIDQRRMHVMMRAQGSPVVHVRSSEQLLQRRRSPDPLPRGFDRGQGERVIVQDAVGDQPLTLR